MPRCRPSELGVRGDRAVCGNLLEAFAARIGHGAHAIQAHYGVLNPHAAWRTRVVTIAMALVHIVRGRARERMHVSCGIKGNGWALTRTVLQQVPYRAYSLAEDLEYAIALGMTGQRVHYADEASVLGEMVTGEQAARKQRQRWEQGRLLLVRTFSVRYCLLLCVGAAPCAWIWHWIC
jgi:1,2-diacylglycerol 3-beta-glucosyltransferase